MDDVDPTLHVIGSSVVAARQKSKTNGRLFLETLGIDEDQRHAVLKDFLDGASEIDPAINYLIAHTNGILYKHLVGRLPAYPIPEIDLPVGHGGYLLDIGCSWGRWSMAAARKGYTAVGIDPSLGAVMAGRRAAKSLGLNIKWVVGDARYLPFRNNLFDVVYSYSVLQHFRMVDLKAVLTEAGRILKPNGCVQIQLANRYGIRSLYHQARRRFREPRDFEVRYLTPQTIKALFSQSDYRTEIRSDCYFGLGLQKSDSYLMPFWKRVLLHGSELLKRMSHRLTALRLVADSVFLIASRR
jgi:2-polyprenyl-3-methyl-5-hydroxy-6-metoxy-1,4-benzoquinol methylase